MFTLKVISNQLCSIFSILIMGYEIAYIPTKNNQIKKTDIRDYACFIKM